MAYNNIYKLTNIHTKVEYRGTAHDLSLLHGFSTNEIIVAYHRGTRFQDIYDVEVIGETNRNTIMQDKAPKTTKKKPNKRLDDMTVEAGKNHMSYGQYVAMKEYGARYREYE